MELEHDLRDSLNKADERSPEVEVSDRRDQDVAHHHAGALPARVDQRQQPLRRAQRLDLHRPRRRHLSRHRRAHESGSRPVRLDRPGVGLHERPIAPAGRTTFEFADHWNAAQALVAPQVALAANSPFFFGQRLRRDPHRALQAGDGHAPDRAEEPRGAPTRVFFASAGSPRSSTSSRRTSATSRRCSPRRRTRTRSPSSGRGSPQAGRAAPAQRHGLSVEPSHLRHRRRRPASARREPRPGESPRSPTSSPMPPSTTAASGSSPARSGRSGPS